MDVAKKKGASPARQFRRARLHDYRSHSIGAGTPLPYDLWSQLRKDQMSLFYVVAASLDPV